MSSKPFIVALNRNQRNLEILSKFLEQEGYSTLGVLNPAALDETVRKKDNISLVLMDISGFNSKVWESCELLRQREIPFLVLSPHQQSAVEKHSKRHGAQGVLVKPLVVKELLLLIKGLIEE
ncbi:MAG TPA: response regulator [Methanobacteriaceae archaeon]|nr:response regulator [Methanobacteriaceae archaeon]